MKDLGEIKKMLIKEMKKRMLSDDGKNSFGKKIAEMKKVTVASPTSEGLEEGLSKAQQILKERKAMKDDDSMPEDETLEACPIEEELENPEEEPVKTSEKEIEEAKVDEDDEEDKLIAEKLKRLYGKRK